MAGLYYEEFFVGQIFQHPIRRTVTEADNVFFTAMTHNPAQLHLDEEYGKKTEFGARIVNSLFTLGLMIGISVGETTLAPASASVGGGGGRSASGLFVGDSGGGEPGGRNWRDPRSRPANGIVLFAHRAFNQRGEMVAVCKRSALMLKKTATA